MAIVRIDNINPDRYRWVFSRAGYSEEKAIEAFPLLHAWLSAEKLPTMNQLQDFAHKFHVPFGYLFLNQQPHESIPFPVFRGKAGQTSHLDINLFDTVNAISARQSWLEDYLVENDIATSSLVGCITLKTPIAEAVEKLRTTLNIPPRWAFSYSSADTAIGVLTQRLEDAGIFVAYNGVVANNTHRKLAVSECRGFALVSKVAPYIFINSDDSKSAQLFTLIHETAHVMLDVSAGHAGTELDFNDVNERYCDMLAAEFLVPASLLHSLWKNDIKQLSRLFKVSEIVIARRAHDLHLLSDEGYRAFWLEYSNRPVKEKKQSSGGNFYLTSVKRVGRLFAIHVRNAVNNRQMSYTEAYRLTGLHGNTYQHFMTHNI